jgi:hypothetical protein
MEMRFNGDGEEGEKDDDDRAQDWRIHPDEKQRK